MRRRIAHDHGFFLCFVLNMIFRSEWLVLSVILFIARYFVSFPVFVAVIPLIVWVIYAFLITLLLSFGNKAGNRPVIQNENKNPYSKKNSDIEHL